MRHLLGLFLSIQKDLYCIAKMKINNENDIEDIIQETMLSAYTNLKKLKNNSFFKTWIIRILINKCNKFYKKKNLKSLDDKQEINIMPTKEIEFENFISFLTEEERTILTLYYSLSYTAKEIAQILQKREGTICSKISRAKTKIKEKYKGEFY